MASQRPYKAEKAAALNSFVSSRSSIVSVRKVS